MADTQQQNKTWGMLSHLSGLIGFIGPLIVWLIKKDEMPVVNTEAKKALNFQLTILIGFIIVFVLGFVLSMVHLGLLTLFLPFIDLALFACQILFAVLGALAGNKGEAYKYPFGLELIK